MDLRELNESFARIIDAESAPPATTVYAGARAALAEQRQQIEPEPRAWRGGMRALVITVGSVLVVGALVAGVVALDPSDTAVRTRPRQSSPPPAASTAPPVTSAPALPEPTTATTTPLTTAPPAPPDPLVAAQQCGYPDDSGTWRTRTTSGAGAFVFSPAVLRKVPWWDDPDVVASRARLEAEFAGGDFHNIMGVVASTLDRKIILVTSVDLSREAALAVRQHIEDTARALDPAFAVDVRIACRPNAELNDLFSDVSRQYGAPAELAASTWIDRATGQVSVYFYGDAGAAAALARQVEDRYPDRVRASYGGTTWEPVTDDSF
jgi:hypothetical protein